MSRPAPSPGETGADAVMCRALKVLCAAPDQDRLTELKRAAVSAVWELTGGARSLDELVDQLSDLEPDVVVVDDRMPQDAVRRIREVRSRARVVGVGNVSGADATASSPAGIRDAILGLPPVGGPIRG
jgi:DNA-binding NarL/FixJ family response regulator